ncbi:MAG: hypothetical protein ABIH37_03130 [archaeon]
MPKKKIVKKSARKTKSKSTSFERQLGREVVEVEKWVHQRKRFFIKLAWVVGFILALIIISNFYLGNIG